MGKHLKKPRTSTPRTPIPAWIRWDVWVRDNFTCQYCGMRRYLAVDHIVPVSKGGETTHENLQTLCRRCNSRKHAKLNYTPPPRAASRTGENPKKEHERGEPAEPPERAEPPKDFAWKTIGELLREHEL